MKEKKLTERQKFAQSGGKARWSTKTEQEKKDHMRMMAKALWKQRRNKAKLDKNSITSSIV